MSMETANTLLSDMRDIKKNRASRPTPPRQSPPSDAMGRLKLGGEAEQMDPFGRQQPVMPTPSSGGYPPQSSYYQQPQPPQAPLPGRPPSAGRVPVPPPYIQEPPRPQPGSYDQQVVAHPQVRSEYRFMNQL